MQRQHLLQFPSTQPPKEPPNSEIQPHMKSKHISGQGHTEDILNKVKQSFNSVTTITPNEKILQKWSSWAWTQVTGFTSSSWWWFTKASMRKTPLSPSRSPQMADRHGEEVCILGEEQAGQGKLVAAHPLIPWFQTQKRKPDEAPEGLNPVGFSAPYLHACSPQD